MPLRKRSPYWTNKMNRLLIASVLVLGCAPTNDGTCSMDGHYAVDCTVHAVDSMGGVADYDIVYTFDIELSHLTSPDSTCRVPLIRSGDSFVSPLVAPCVLDDRTEQIEEVDGTFTCDGRISIHIETRITDSTGYVDQSVMCRGHRV